MSSKKIYSSLPSRPLSLVEAESLTDSKKRFAPLSLLSEYPEWLDGHEWDAENLKNAASAFVITLLYGTEERATVLGFSEPDGGWVEIDSWAAEDYDQKEVEEAVQDWGRETYPDWKHGTMDFDDSV